MPMPVSTWAEVDLDRFASNLAAVRKDLPPECGVLLVVKADAYGHGAVEITEVGARDGVSALGVATLHEGIQLRQARCALPIVALSPLLKSEIREALAHGLDPTVPDPGFGAELSAAALRSGHPVRFHVEVDTGMGRTGVREEEAEDFITKLVSLPGLRLGSVFTHFPDADSEDVSFAESQNERLQALVTRLRAKGVRVPRVHASNSAGTLNVAGAAHDWVRVGLVAYGHLPPHARRRPPVVPALSFKSRLVQVRDVPAGTPISYGRTFITKQPSRIGVVAVGYGHGYSWLMSNRGSVLVSGKRAPIVGRVTMDLTMVDLSEVPEAAVEDEVVLFGEQGTECITLEEVARWSETLQYEIMCTIGKRVTRIYVAQGRPVKLVSLVGERTEWTRQAAEHFRLRDTAIAAARRA